MTAAGKMRHMPVPTAHERAYLSGAPKPREHPPGHRQASQGPKNWSRKPETSSACASGACL